MEKIAIEDIAKYRFISGLTFSPKGEKAAFILRQGNKKLDSYDTDIYLYENKKKVRLTRNEKVGFFIFEDDDHLLYLSLKKAKENKKKGILSEFIRLDLNSKKKEVAFTLPLAVSSLEKMDDGRYLIGASVNLNRPDFHKLSQEDKEKYLKEAAEEADYRLISEQPWWFNGAGFINGLRSNLFIYDPKDGLIERVHEAEIDAGTPLIIKDSLYFSGAIKKVKASLSSAIYKYDLGSKNLKLIVPEGDYSVNGLYELEGKVAVVASLLNGKYGLNENSKFFYLNEEEGDLDLVAEPDYGFSGTLTDVAWGHGGGFKSDKHDLYFTLMDRYDTPIMKMDPKGNFSYVGKGKGAFVDFDVKEGKLITAGLFGDRLEELYEIVEGKPKRASNLNGAFLKGKYVATPKKVRFKSHGWDLDGWIMFPKDYDPNKKYPAVLDIHGGPKCAYGTIFFHEMQVWASEGYFVFYCNPVGGDGRGDEFADIRGKYGSIDYENIMDFVDVILKKYPQIDPARVCETGGSYGGFMTNWIATHSDRFCALATQRSISDWTIMEANSDIGIYFDKDQCAGGDLISPEGREQLRKFSPINYAENLKTPLLVIHSEEDYRCPIENGYMIYTACVEKEVETRMVVFKGENHDLSRGGAPKHRIRRLKEITDWFEKHAK